MQILQSSHHLRHGLLQQVQRQWSILSLLVEVVLEITSVAVAALVVSELELDFL